MYECVFSRHFNCNFKEFAFCPKRKLVQRKVDNDVKIFLKSEKCIWRVLCKFEKIWKSLDLKGEYSFDELEQNCFLPG
jgi:hypothetical protein